MRKENKDYRSDCTAIINNGFFCQSCLEGKRLADISLDPRYCQFCYDFLRKEAEMLSPGKRPSWIPKKAKIGHQKSIQVSGGRGIKYVHSKRQKI